MRLQKKEAEKKEKTERSQKAALLTILFLNFRLTEYKEEVIGSTPQGPLSPGTPKQHTVTRRRVQLACARLCDAATHQTPRYADVPAGAQ